MKQLTIYIFLMIIAWLASLSHLINIILEKSDMGALFVGLICSSIYFTVMVFSKIKRIIETQ